VRILCVCARHVCAVVCGPKRQHQCAANWQNAGMRPVDSVDCGHCADGSFPSPLLTQQRPPGFIRVCCIKHHAQVRQRNKKQRNDESLFRADIEVLNTL